VKPDILILDEPTRGIDVGAKYEIYTIMTKLLQQGMSIIMLSSELPEILGMSDRVYIVSSGRISGELPIKEATQEKIMHLANELRRLAMSFFNNAQMVLRRMSVSMECSLRCLSSWLYSPSRRKAFLFRREYQQPSQPDGYIAVLAVGMTLVIVIRHIDLSVGFLAGWLGAIAAIAMVFWHLPVYAAIPLVLVIGILAVV